MSEAEFSRAPLFFGLAKMPSRSSIEGEGGLEGVGADGDCVAASFLRKSGSAAVEVDDSAFRRAVGVKIDRDGILEHGVALTVC